MPTNLKSNDLGLPNKCYSFQFFRGCGGAFFKKFPCVVPQSTLQAPAFLTLRMWHAPSPNTAFILAAYSATSSSATNA